MSKKKHFLDWYIDNMPSNDKKYESGCCAAVAIIAVIFAILVISILIIE